MEGKPTEMLWMMPAGWPSHLVRTGRWAVKALPQGCLVARMRKFTLLDDATPGFGGTAADDGIGEADRRQQLAGPGEPGGKRRHLFGVGRGPAEAVAEAKQESMGVMPEICVNFVSVATDKSLLAPLVTHLSTT